MNTRFRSSESSSTYREMAGGLTGLYMSAVSNKMNEVMKVLTIRGYGLHSVDVHRGHLQA
ncbi:MAG: CorA family divalent cation transporter [Gammaproteobacteria bacterium]|nr:CorA family divalent cation transporter [Gammaproteobacteria bacterium]